MKAPACKRHKWLVANQYPVRKNGPTGHPSRFWGIRQERRCTVCQDEDTRRMPGVNGKSRIDALDVARPAEPKPAPKPAPPPRLCRKDNWGQVLDDPAPRAVRWATRLVSRLFNEPDWGKWHYTEGNGSFTACGQPVVLFEVDGSPQEHSVDRVTCRRCLAKMRHAAVSTQE